MDAVLDRIIEAKSPEDIFGDLDGQDAAAKLAAVKRTYRQLVRTVHPDVLDDPRAGHASARLGRFYAIAQEAIAKGTYGTPAAPLADEVLVRTRRHAYRVKGLHRRGDATNVYAATLEDGEHALVKVVRDRRDGDLVAAEGKALKHLLSNTDTYDLLSPFLPAYIESFGFRPGRERPRQASTFRWEPRLFTLVEVRDFYRDGVHPKHAAWMLRRVLQALGLVHANELVHGALVPEHLLVHPEHHGVVLIDWKHAVAPGKAVPAIVGRRRDYYPPEVLDRKPARPSTDIYMAMRCLEYVMGDVDVPTQIRAFIRGCSQPSAKARPMDAFDLLDEFDELLERLWGPRRFVPFPMPPFPTN